MNLHGRVWGVLLTAVLCLAGSAVCRGVTAGTEVSERRLALIRQAVQEELAKQGFEAGVFGLTKAVLAEFFRQEPDCPAGVTLAEPVTEAECREAARQVHREVVAKNRPDLDKAAIEAEAAKLFPVYAEGDIVEVEFQPNPARRDRVRGPYQGRTPNAVVIGRRQIMVVDIAAVKGNEALLLMLDATRSGELRKAYVDGKVNAYNEEKEKYSESVRLVARREQYLLGAQRNEERGYVFLDGAWRSVRDAVPIVIEAERSARLAEQRRQVEQAAAAALKEATAVAAAEVAIAARGASAPAGDPQAELAELNARIEAEKQRASESVASADTSGETTAVSPEGPEHRTSAASATVAIAEEDGGVTWVVVAVVLLFVLATAGFFAYTFMRQRAARDPRKFFEGHGRLERNFWALADADPEHFKYVAYRFPTMEDARAALLHLSFISEGPGNQLRSSRELEFGLYPHQDKWVCFVGGTDMHYALWREASAILPELPQAEYFRVSTAPDVQLEVPDIEQLLRDEALSIEHVENREGVGDDFSQYYVYRAPDKKGALDFLKRANVSEAGVHVVVQTPEGTWGKDENGIYEE
jgi:hypothetical protein